MIPRSLPEPAPDPLADAVAEIGSALGLESVTVVGDATAPVRWGAPSRLGNELDLRHRGELVGLLQVTTRPGHPLTREARAVLRALATVAAAVVVADRDAADVRREVHDRLGPTLAGIGLGLQGVRSLAGDLDALQRAEQADHAQPEDRVVVHDGDPDRRVRGISHRSPRGAD